MWENEKMILTCEGQEVTFETLKRFTGKSTGYCMLLINKALKTGEFEYEDFIFKIQAAKAPTERVRKGDLIPYIYDGYNMRTNMTRQQILELTGIKSSSGIYKYRKTFRLGRYVIGWEDPRPSIKELFAYYAIDKDGNYILGNATDIINDLGLPINKGNGSLSSYLKSGDRRVGTWTVKKGKIKND